MLLTVIHKGSNTSGFTYHESTPKISAVQVNPSEDKQIEIEMAGVENVQVRLSFK